MTKQGERARRRAAWLAGVFVLLLAPPAAPQTRPPASPEGLEAVANRAGRCVVAISAQQTVTRTPPGRKPVSRTFTRVGSGVAVEESLILTTASVVLGSERIVVRAANGLEAEARPAGMDLIFNVALLRVEGLRLPYLKRAERPAQLGDRVIVVGTSYRAQSTQSVGMVEYVYREPRTSLLQLTNIVYPGNSGGAALNTSGELVGIVQGELGSPDPGIGTGKDRRPSGMSFVMPIQDVRPVYESLKRTGRMPHGYLGVSTRAETVQSEVDNATVGLGARVEAVRAKGPAERAGIRRGDLIVAFESERVEYPEQLARWVSETRPGTSVKLVWVHGDVQRVGHTVLGTSPDSLPTWAVPVASLRSASAARVGGAPADSAGP
jgi:S1-C subfamily serine protease